MGGSKRMEKSTMGDEADADWQAGLGEWGIEDARAWYRDRLERAVKTSPFRTPRKNRRRAARPADLSQVSEGE
jgi:hypothetical protein